MELCVPAGVPWYVSGIRGATKPDFLWLYFNNIFMEEIGEPCASGAGAAECLAEVARLRGNVPVGGPTIGAQTVPLIVPPFLLTTVGDRVEPYAGEAAIFDFIRPIDTVQEATLVLTFRGEVPNQCDVPASSDERSIRRVEDGYEIKRYATGCNGNEIKKVADDGTLSTIMNAQGCVVEGRRPAGLLAAVPAASTALGAHLARAAHFEAASVHAFARLEQELSELGAPAELVTCALRSALDEVQHARVMTGLARRFGGEPAQVVVNATGRRGALELALENAVEGCVGETLAALVASHQGATARDPEIRSAMAAIAEDELRHAELAWSVASWLEPRLTDRERELVGAARTAALASLRASLGTPELPERARALAGLPPPHVAQALCDRLAAFVAVA